MAISQTRYVNIVSGVGAASAVSTRSLIGRFFTTNPLVPTNNYVEFTDADQVGAYFGTSSEEYARAAFYFGWVSKNITQPQKISFAHWNSAASAPLIYGAVTTQAIATWNAISNGAFSLTLGGTTNSLTGMDFSGAANLAAVAAIIQAKIRTQTGSMWTAATVVYNATRGSFDLVGGVTGAAAIAVAAGTGGSDIAGQLGWLSASAILSPGAAIQTITEVLTGSANQSNNFGSFAFLPSLTQNQIVEAATWNDTQDNLYMYSVRCTSSTAAALSAALANYDGTTLTLAPLSNEYPEQAPMMILAATDYTAPNSTQNYMFNIFGLTPSVTTDLDANTYDALRVNYYGQTQSAGNLIQFYQRGLMMGLPADPADQNVYANEQWLKDAASAALLTLLLALPKVPANNAGVSQITAILQGVINQALLNGTISVGKALSTVQKLYIAELTGDPKAWYDVQNTGYWVNVRIVPYVESGVTKYKAVYVLVYSKDDIIRRIEGSDILI